MDWAQAAFGVRNFIVSVSPNNRPSLALIARFGFARIGQRVDEMDGPEDVYLREVTTYQCCNATLVRSYRRMTYIAPICGNPI
jgi:RimJ/RimL family protein N-acetyltransferase